MTHRRSPPAAQPYTSRSLLHKSRGALGANYGAIHKSKSLMVRLSPRLFKRDPVFFYIISISAPWIHFAISWYEKNRGRRTEEWEKSSEKNCKNFSYARARGASRSVIRREISALLLRVFLSAGISSTQEAMRLHESIRRIAGAMHSSILTTSVAVLV